MGAGVFLSEGTFSIVFTILDKTPVPAYNKIVFYFYKVENNHSYRI